MLWVYLNRALRAFLMFVIPPPVSAPVPTMPMANPAEACPICGHTQKLADRGILCVGTAAFIGLQFTCAQCKGKWFKTPVRPGWSSKDGMPAEELKPIVNIPMVEV
jgi:hypothetical protein